MNKLLNKYHPLTSRLLFWNVIMLVVVKLVFPQSAFQLASIVDSIPIFDSREIIAITNEARSSQSLPPLKANSQLDLAASEKLNDMATKEYFAHVSPDRVTPWFWIKNSQYQYSVAGENLAIGFFTPNETIRAWLNSPSHRANIMNSKYRDIGVAVKGVKIGSREGLLVVQMFGSPIQTNLTNRQTPASSTNQAIPISTPPTVASQVALTTPVLVAETKGETVANLISTDVTVEPVINPITVSFDNTETIMNWPQKLNTAFSAYTFIVAALSLLAFYLFEKNKNTAFRVSLNFAIFIMAILLPVYQQTFNGLIF